MRFAAAVRLRLGGLGVATHRGAARCLRREMRSSANLFAGIADCVDRTCSFVPVPTSPGADSAGTITRTSADFNSSAIANAATTTIVFDGTGRVAVSRCGACGGAHLIRWPPQPLLRAMSERLGGTDAVTLFDTSSLALGTLTAGDGFPPAGTPPSSNLVCATELSKIPDPEAFLSAHARASGVSCTCRHCASAIPAADVAASLKMMDGRELLFGKGTFRRLHPPAELQRGSDGKAVAGALGAGGASSLSPAASPGSSAAAASDRAAEVMLRPEEIAWPLPFTDAALYGLARGLMAWHYKHKFCGVCAAPLVAREGGAKKQCSSAACGTSLYPRVDPVVITLIRSADNSRVLLGRQPGFPPGWYSCLAGYAENGESLEDAVRREVHEESGMRLSGVRYHSSQPWPIGRGTYGQLMIGFVGTAHSDAPDALVVDRTELEDARWFGREEVAAAVAAHFIERAPRSEGGGGGGRGRAASAKPTSGSGAAAPAAADTSTYSTPSTTAPEADAPSVAGSTAGAQAEAGALPGSPSAPEGAARARGQALKVPGPYAIAHVLLQAWLRGEC